MKEQNHSRRSAEQSKIYHAKVASVVINPNRVGRAKTKATRLEQQLNSNQDWSEKGHKL